MFHLFNHFWCRGLKIYKEKNSYTPSASYQIHFYSCRSLSFITALVEKQILKAVGKKFFIMRGVSFGMFCPGNLWTCFVKTLLNCRVSSFNPNCSILACLQFGFFYFLGDIFAASDLVNTKSHTFPEIFVTHLNSLFHNNRFTQILLLWTSISSKIS